MKTFGWMAISLIALLLVVACQGAPGPAGPAGAPGPQGPPGPAGAPPAETQITNIVSSVLAGTPPDPKTLAHGGRLYDKWWAEMGAATPSGNSTLWALQTTNTRSGGDTWRCKECHGWDYKGKGGAYSSGSHYTGFPGVYTASSLTKEQLTQIMGGGTDYRHDFRKSLPEPHLGHIVSFIKWGVVNDALYIDYVTKKPIGANTANGKKLYDSTCAGCHGSNGRQILFHEKEGIGNVATDNPWETLHKIRFGQPGTAMPSAIVNGWSMPEVVDILGYAQTLPTQ